ncbi:MAG TPA: DsbA family protein [Candidatus Limnocylindrales bacterium]
MTVGVFEGSLELVRVNRDAPQDAIPRLALPVGERDHVQGPATAAVTLVEYGDYECPYCRAAVSIVQELQGLLQDRLRFVFRHFPLDNLHPHARQAAEAAEGAGTQGKFFEMHAALFEHQEALEDEDLLRYAAELGLDTGRFRDDLNSHAHARRIREDFESGIRSGARGTPTFYLDDVRYDSVVGVRQLLAAIRAAHPDLIDEGLEARLQRRTIPRVIRQRSPFERRSR